MAHQLIAELMSLEPLLCAITLAVMAWRRLIGDYRWVAALVTVRLCSDMLLMLVIFGRVITSPYKTYFFVYWGSYAIEAGLSFMVILTVYKLAMEPLPGLQALGMIMFRWAAAISATIAVTMGFGPHLTGSVFIVRVVSQLQEIQSVLTLCMLVFVCFAIRPMGLSYRSRAFGISAALALLATSDLATAAWLPHAPQMNAALSAFSGFAVCGTLLIWSVYFALPEPARRMILLPTTSPFFVWNQISLALGDTPGYVAVGEVSPELFAPAELEMMRRASVRMAKVEEFQETLAS